MVNSKGEWVLSSTKTASSERTIPLGPTIIKLLKEHRLWIKKNKLFYGPHYIDSEHVCVKESGEPITPSSMKYNTNKLKKRTPNSIQLSLAASYTRNNVDGKWS